MFGTNLKQIRKKKGYTQTQLANIAGVTQRVIEYYENHVKRPSLDKVKKLSHALDVSDEELLGIAKSPGKKKSDDVSYKILKKVRVIEELPTRDQNAIFHFINALVEKNKVREKNKPKKK